MEVQQQIEQTVRGLQEVIHLRLCELLELIFRAQFNLARAQLVVTLRHTVLR